MQYTDDILENCTLENNILPINLKIICGEKAFFYLFNKYLSIKGQLGGK